MLSITMNREGAVLHPAMMQKVLGTLGPDTAYPDPEVQKDAETYPSSGSCVVATVIYAGLMGLTGQYCPLKPIVVKDTEQLGNPLEQHMMLTDGINLVDFTDAKNGEGDFELYSDREMDRMMQWLLDEPTLEARIQTALNKMEDVEFTAEQVLGAFRQAYEEGKKLTVSEELIRSQLGDPGLYH